jgi:hypothetical protein
MITRIAFITLGFITSFLTLFSLYGFLHSAELGTHFAWRIGYFIAILIFASLSFILFRNGIRKQ